MNKDFFKTEYRDRITSSVGRFMLEVVQSSMIYYYIEGDGQLFFFIDDQFVELHRGDVIIVKKGTLFASIKKQSVRYARFISHFPNDFESFIGNYDEIMAKLLAFSGAKIFKTDSDAEKSLFKLAKDNSSNIKYGMEAIRIITEELLLISKLGYKEINSIGKSTDLLGSIFNMVNTDYQSISSAKDLAFSLGYSVNYISEYFKKRMNIGLHEFIVFIKLSQAVNMLNEGKSVTEAAYECGFSSTSHFIEVFKRRYSVTPKQFFKKIGEK